jgi:CRISPR-associated endonuclease/helicase Cas3
MNVFIISQCSKKAREKSCQIIDQFAERMGDSAWQTVITQDGLSTLRKLLRKTARRNTAVACHWLKKNGQSELLWIVGNPRRFNAEGRVPTNRTTRQVIHADEGDRWHCAESIALLAAIAGLFHDFGKSGHCFQQSLLGKSERSFQPWRHEWVSLRLFQAFVAEDTDEQWLSRLGTLSAEDEITLLSRLRKDNIRDSDSPFRSLPPVAKVVGWLILSHHRLPDAKDVGSPEYCDTWLENQLCADWNATHHRDHQWNEKVLHSVWTFPQGTPLQSKTWREKARQIARRVGQTGSLTAWGQMDQLLVLHLSRFCLMLADHVYSSQPPQARWQDPAYPLWANTDRTTRAVKQQVDEHLIGVAQHALFLGRSLPKIRTSLPALARHKGFRQRAVVSRFLWQNKAWDVATALRERSRGEGFFGINMASTGCGKTFANARIMYALSDEQEGCRFTVALGLRTLTLQTGDALRARLSLDQDDMAVLIGSRAVSELYAAHKRDTAADSDSASAEALFDEHQHIRYEGSLHGGVLEKWLSGDPRLSALVSAPVVVATLDNLIPATEGVRGGRQLPAMLRLLTSDLVLDEPDDFDVADLHALCRLVNWAGMLGSRVLLSSATLPPNLVQALFAAYLAGRKIWQASCGAAEKQVNICCAWFDEHSSTHAQIANGSSFKSTHQQFATKRAVALEGKPVLHRARMVDVNSASTQPAAVMAAMAQTLHHEMLSHHQAHKQTHSSGKTVSQGIVRFANIDPLVAVAQALMAIPSPEDYCIHYCAYHAKHPLAVRSAIENCLDRAFDRSDETALWQQTQVVTALRAPQKHHLFVVLGTSVIEVGRDWDADWGIIEPSSMRSIIQFAGRIQRHRQRGSEHENITLLRRNIRALKNECVAFHKPGFETTTHLLPDHDLQALIPERDVQAVNAIPRILPGDGQNKLAALEHRRLWDTLLNSKTKEVIAALWWRKTEAGDNAMTWHSWLQRKTPFRRSQPEQMFFLHMADEEYKPAFMLRADDGSLKKAGNFRLQTLSVASGVSHWGTVDYREALLNLAEKQGLEIEKVGQLYGEIRLRESEEGAVEDWLYHPWLGVFRALK